MASIRFGLVSDIGPHGLVGRLIGQKLNPDLEFGSELGLGASLNLGENGENNMIRKAWAESKCWNVGWRMSKSTFTFTCISAKGPNLRFQCRAWSNFDYWSCWRVYAVNCWSGQT